MQAKPEPGRSYTTGAEEIEERVLQLSMARGLDEVFAIVRESARPLIGADGVTFILRDGDKCHYAEEDAISPLWKGMRFPMQNCVSGWSMLNRQPAIIEDIYADPRVPHEAYRPTFVKSMVMMPVRRDDPVAAIGAYWSYRHLATEAELRILQRLANAAAVAITNVGLINELKRAQQETEQAKDAIIMALGSLAETRDNETGNHVLRTQRYVRALADAARHRAPYSAQLDDETIAVIFKSAPLHDIGKVGIPDRVLLKPGRLSAREYAIMKSHVEIGHAAIANAARHLGACTPFFEIAQEIALSHHERWDGAGYPQGLAGDAIPLSGRLMAIADVYDALVSVRVYKDAIPHADAVEIIRSEAGRQFDPGLVDVFLEIADEFEAIHRRFADDPETRPRA